VKHLLSDVPLSLRVCIVVPYDLADPGGGVKHHAVQLARLLRQQGHHATILGASSAETQEPHTFGIRGIVNVPSNGSDNRMALLASRSLVKRFFDERTFDVVHVHEPPIPSISYWTAWLTPGIPKMSTFHAFAESPPLGLRLLQRLGGAIQYSFFDHAVAVSPSAARFARAAWRRPLGIVPNGIPIDLFTPALRPASPGPSRRLLAIGRLADARKGIATMIEAFRILKARDDGWSLDIVGEDATASRAPAISGLTYHPPLPLNDLIERYRECDIFVAPSTSQESFGIVLLEAMATGKPIVCSDIEGYRHVADPGGAVFVPPRDPAALADALDRLMPDEPRRRAMAAFNLAYVRRFDWSLVAKSIVDEYLITIENYRIRRGLPTLGLLQRWCEHRTKPGRYPWGFDRIDRGERGDRIEAELGAAVLAP
jgi:phosphatidylinositol alpha-mannosyltransferase